MIILNEDTFEKEFAIMLSEFDDMFETQENFNRIAREVKEDLPDSSDLQVSLEFQRRLNFERTNNLIRVALKKFLVTD